MPARERYTAKQVADALRKAKGYKTEAAKLLGCTGTTVFNYCRKYEICRQVERESNEEINDLAEMKLHKLIADGDLRAIMFRLRFKAKDRGYVERVEYSGPKGGAIEFRFTADQAAQADKELEEWERQQSNGSNAHVAKLTG